MDCMEAFDTVQHNWLLIGMAHVGAPPEFLDYVTKSSNNIITVGHYLGNDGADDVAVHVQPFYDEGDHTHLYPGDLDGALRRFLARAKRPGGLSDAAWNLARGGQVGQPVSPIGAAMWAHQLMHDSMCIMRFLFKGILVSLWWLRADDAFVQALKRLNIKFVWERAAGGVYRCTLDGGSSTLLLWSLSSDSPDGGFRELDDLAKSRAAVGGVGEGEGDLRATIQCLRLVCKETARLLAFYSARWARASLLGLCTGHLLACLFCPPLRCNPTGFELFHQGPEWCQVVAQLDYKLGFNGRLFMSLMGEWAFETHNKVLADAVRRTAQGSVRWRKYLKQTDSKGHDVESSMELAHVVLQKVIKGVLQRQLVPGTAVPAQQAKAVAREAKRREGGSTAPPQQHGLLEMNKYGGDYTKSARGEDPEQCAEFEAGEPITLELAQVGCRVWIEDVQGIILRVDLGGDEDPLCDVLVDSLEEQDSDWAEAGAAPTQGGTVVQVLMSLLRARTTEEDEEEDEEEDGGEACL
ncbi:hypothetical protein T484DRAFT_1858810 [Baffinella frigidus]|nr:hypothetical protein T484DRAFT_1858810 [Cryptophyta sp. CCMP2293]